MPFERPETTPSLISQKNVPHQVADNAAKYFTSCVDTATADQRRKRTSHHLTRQKRCNPSPHHNALGLPTANQFLVIAVEYSTTSQSQGAHCTQGSLHWLAKEYMCKIYAKCVNMCNVCHTSLHKNPHTLFHKHLISTHLISRPFQTICKHAMGKHLISCT